MLHSSRDKKLERYINNADISTFDRNCADISTFNKTSKLIIFYQKNPGMVSEYISLSTKAVKSILMVIGCV